DRLGTGPGGEPSAVQVPHLPMRFYDPRRRLEEARRPLVGASSSFLPYGPDTNSTRGNPSPWAGRARAEAELPHIDPRRGVLSTELGLPRVERVVGLRAKPSGGCLQRRLRVWCPARMLRGTISESPKIGRIAWFVAVRCGAMLTSYLSWR